MGLPATVGALRSLVCALRSLIPLVMSPLRVPWTGKLEVCPLLWGIAVRGYIPDLLLDGLHRLVGAVAAAEEGVVVVVVAWRECSAG